MLLLESLNDETHYKNDNTNFIICLLDFLAN